METGDVASSDAVFSSVLRALQENYEQYAGGGWNTLRAEFERRDILQGRRVRVDSGHEHYTGVVTGLDENGTLQVQTTQEKRLVVAGDVKLDE
jgi:BirA family biotin operon repressor/biotin-[acetyl-CoA-carboxylase] ligase